MTRTHYLWSVIAGMTLSLYPAAAAEPRVAPLEPAGGFGWRPAMPCPPVIPCPPWPCPPVAPATPGTTDPSMPGQPPPSTPSPITPDTFGQQGTQRGTEAYQTNAPNLFGDLLGGRPSTVRVQLNVPGALNGQTAILALPAVFTNPGVSGNLQDARVRITGVLAPPIGPLGVNQPITETPPGFNVRFAPQNAAVINGVLNYLALPPGPAVANPPLGLNPNLQGTLYNVAAAYETGVNPQATLQSFTLGPVQALYDGTELQYLSLINSTVSVPGGGGGGGRPVVISVPNPGAGGVVGFVKIAEDNNPMPRDRVIFTYDYFGEAALTPDGIPLNRYQFGFEKTFFGGWTSFEVRLPFAGTLASDAALGAQTLGTELGNLRLAVKALLLRRDAVNVSAGLAVFLPTADEVNIRDVTGADLIHVENTSVQLSPFVAVLVTPNDRLFAQAWLGMAFDTGGNAVTVNPTFFGGAANVGSLRAGTTLLADLQLGYWVYRAQTGLLRGLAPFVELHYNGTVGNGSVLTAGNGFFIGDTGGNLDELNISAGCIAQLGENTNLAVGASAPLRTGQNRTFDYQVGVRLNWYYGYTARQRSAAYQVSTFGP